MRTVPVNSFRLALTAGCLALFLPGVVLGAATPAGPGQAIPTAQVSYASFRFVPEEGWSLRARGNGGTSRLQGRELRLDFSQGAEGFSLVPHERTLPGKVDRIHLRVHGSVQDLPVRIHLRTHFMTFHRAVGRINGDGHLTVASEGPPGPGWEWFGGENDGKFHGPLRLGEIRFERPATGGVVELELEEVIIDSSCPASKRCLVTAACEEGSDGPEYRFTARALTDIPIPASVRWILRDWEGTVVGQGRRELELPVQAGVTGFEFPVPAPARERLKFLEAEFQTEVAGQEIAPVQAVWVAPLEDQGTPELRPDSPFGMGVYLYRYPDNTGGHAEMESAAAMAQAAGVKWSREEFQWARIEPRRGEFRWDFYDQLVATAKRHGIQVYAIVAYWSGWTQPYTAEGIEDYLRYLEALVRRYGRDIRQWEIWNEPNIFFWQGPKDLYADLLKKSYAAVKAIDPDAEVLGLSTAGIDFNYIRRMLELEAPFDILTIHPYRRVLEDRTFLADLRRASDLVQKPDGTRRPVWLTELGWSTYAPHNVLGQDFAPTSLRAQAELITRCYLIAIVSGIDPRTFWYNFRNDGDDPFYFEHQMGIVDRRFRPKPAYRTFGVLARMLEGWKPARELFPESDTLAWEFIRPGDAAGRLTVLWNPRADAEIAVPVGPGNVERVNAVGERQVLQGDGGKLTVRLRQDAPVYLRQ
jgi:hypothetical protein